MAYLDPTSLEYAGLDVASISAVVNGDQTQTVTTRLGRSIKSLAKVIYELSQQDIGESAAALINQRLDTLEALSDFIYISSLFNVDNVDWTKRLSPSTGNMGSADDEILVASNFIAVTAGEWYAIGGTALNNVHSGHVVGFFVNDSTSTAVAKATLVSLSSTGYLSFKFQVPTGLNIVGMRVQFAANTRTNHAVDGELQINAGQSLTDYPPIVTLSQGAFALLFNNGFFKDELLGPDVLMYDEVIEAVVGKNLIDPDEINYVRRYTVGAKELVIDVEGLAASGYIPVAEGETYVISGAGMWAGRQGGYFANAGDATAISNMTIITYGGGYTFTVPAGLGINYAVLNLRKLNDLPASTTLHGTVQLEKGDIITVYAPFSITPQIKSTLLPSTSEEVSISESAWLNFTGADASVSLGDRWPVFRQHWLKKDKDLCVVHTGTSLTARTTEHHSTHSEASSRPPLMHSLNCASLLWDAMKWDNQNYRRYDYPSFFTEPTGTWATDYSLGEWDDGPYRNGLTRYSGTTGASVRFTIPANTWAARFIYRTDTTGAEQVQITVTEGNGVLQVENSSGVWVEANGHVFSMRESAPVARGISIPNPDADNSYSTMSIASKGNTTYQKRIKMRSRWSGTDTRATAKTVTMTGLTSGRMMYWGLEWSPREYMLTYVNAARGGHNTNALTTLGLPRFQDNEVWSFAPDLLFFELAIYNDGAHSSATQAGGRWRRLADNYIFNGDYELSLAARGAYHGLTPEIGFFTASVGPLGIAAGGGMSTGIQGDGTVMSSLDKFSQAVAWTLENHSEIVVINATRRWVDAATAIYGSLLAGQTQSERVGPTMTHDGEHWNDVGSRIMAKALLPLFRFM